MFELNASDVPQGSFQRQKLSNTMTIDPSSLKGICLVLNQQNWVS